MVLGRQVLPGEPLLETLTKRRQLATETETPRLLGTEMRLLQLWAQGLPPAQQVEMHRWLRLLPMQP